MIRRLEIFQADKGRFNGIGELSQRLKTDKALRDEIEILTKAFLNKNVSGCSNCYADAYIELINLNIQTIMEKKKTKFVLLAGALLRDVVNGDAKKLCSQANITDELALYHLKTNPKCRDLFQQLPDNLDKMMKEYELPTGTNKEEKKNDSDTFRSLPDVSSLIEERNSLVERLEKKEGIISDLNDEIKERDDIISEQDIEISELKNKLAELSGKESAGVTKTDLQEKTENEFIAKIAEQLNAGVTKTAIKKQFSSVDNIGSTKLTTRALSEFIKKAEEFNTQD